MRNVYYQQLTEGQRYQIEILFKAKFSLTEIAPRMGFHESTLS
ncbi:MULTISPECIES: helix-turn-helix domain-containing protein [Xenorhabdus]